MKQIFFVTWATHNSRISERMFHYKVKVEEPFLLTDEMRNYVCQFLNEKIKKENYSVLAKNILNDHVHIVLACEKDDISKIVQNLKGYTSFSLGRKLKLSEKAKGRQHKMWAKGSSYTLLDNEKRLFNAIKYTNDNHLKHELSPLKNDIQFAGICDYKNVFTD